MGDEHGDGLTYRRLCQAAGRQSDAERRHGEEAGLSDATQPGGQSRTGDAAGGGEAGADIRRGPWWRVRGLRRFALRDGVSIGGLFVLAFVAANAAGWWLDAARLAHGPTATAEATVLDADGVLLPGILPDNITVRFRTEDGRLVHTSIAHGGHLPEPGRTLPVEYSVAAPSHARAAGEDSLARGVAVSGGLAALCLARIGWRAARSARITRRLVLAARSPEAHPVRYLRLHTRDGGHAWLLMFPLPGRDDDAPSHLLPLRSAPRTNAAGTACLRGDVRTGGVVVPWIDGRPVWPSGELAAFGPEAERFVARELVR